MPSNEKFPVSIVISAVDGVTAKIRSIQQSVNKTLSPIRRINNSFQQLGEVSGIGAFAKALGATASKTSKVLSEARKLALKLGAIAVAGAYAGFQLVRSFAKAGDEASDAADALGISVRAYQELAGAAKVAGLEQETFSSSMDRFSKNIGEAAAGGELASIFRALGVNVRDAGGRVKQFDSVLPDVAEKLSRIQNANVRNAVGAKIFGKQFKELIPFLKGGAAGVAELRNRAVGLGAVMSKDNVEAGDKLFRILGQLELAFTGVKNTIIGALAPTLIKLAEQFTEFIVDNREEIRKWTESFARDLPGNLKALSEALKSLGQTISPLVSLVKTIGDHFGWIKTIALVLSVALGGKLILAVLGLLETFGPLILAFGKFILPALAIVKWAVVFTAALLGLPVWGVVAAVAALTAAGIALYKYWEPISTFFSDLGSAIKVGFLAQLELVRAEIGYITALIPKSIRTRLGIDAEVSNPSLGRGELGPALGAGQFATPVNSSQRIFQEASVAVTFGNLPAGSRVESKSGGVPLDVSWGIGGMIK